MPNAVKTTKKKLFEKKHVGKNGNLIKNSFVRPFAREFTKNMIHPGAFFLTLQDPTIK
jgi:hypothetical protein